MRFLTILIDKKVHAKFKVLCAMEGVSMTSVILELISEWMKKR